MAYLFEKLSILNGHWSVHLLFQQEILPHRGPVNVRLPLDCMNGQSNPDYKIVSPRQQIDDNGKLFVCTAWNIRQQISSTQHVGTPLAGVRYATQYDFDKFCFENPDERYPLDWNAEVYKVFMSYVPGTYSPAENGTSP